jgi:micrococcal nuclease
VGTGSPLAAAGVVRPAARRRAAGRIGLGLFLAFCWCALPTVSVGADPTVWGTVAEVAGATRLNVESPDSGLLKLRLLGVQTPEPPNPRARGEAREGQPFGEQAFAYIRNLLLGKQVQVKAYGGDRRGRILAVVWLGDINVNLDLVKQGLAWMEPSLRILAIRAPLEVAERQAQVGRYGLWQLPNPEPPWDFRRRHRLPAE